MTSNQNHPACLTSIHRLLLLGAFAALPLVQATAQDFDAVEKRLGKAVSKGELTLKQASAMMAVLKSDGRSKAELGTRLKAAVAEGKLSGPEARMKWAEAEMKQAVAEGEIMGKDARERLQEMRKAIAARLASRKDDLDVPDWDRIRRRVEAPLNAAT